MRTTEKQRRGLGVIRSLGWVLLSCAAVQAQKPMRSDAAARKARAAQFLAGRKLAGGGSAAQALATARRQSQAMAAAQGGNTSLSAAWTPVGPMQVTTAEFGAVTGRVTSLALDPADTTGNTLYVGTTGGGVWKSTNAAGSATFTSLTDNLPVFSSGATASLSIGSLAMANGVLLAGTGDPNDATDSYYGSGILRSADGGVTWTLAQQSQDGVSGNHSFFGLSFSGLAFSSANPALAVAALGQAVEGDLVNAANQTSAMKGLYYSADAGVTWHMATIIDGSQTVQGPNQINSGGGNAATAVVWNPVRQMFYAAVRYHGYYGSADGVTWSRLASQPGAGLTTTACPPNAGGVGSPACPILRGALTVQPVTGDLFALTVDSANADQGLYQDVCGLTNGSCANSAPVFANAINATPLESGAAKTIAQGDYDLALAAAPSGTDTLLFVGTIDLYRCSLASGCVLRNTTNAQDGCLNPAGVAPAQHALAVLGSTVYVGNDGGLWRSTDGVAETGAVCSLSDANHFQNLNAGLGSLAEVVSFAQHPASAGALLSGLGALGTAGTSTVTNSWAQLATGEGGTVAIDAANPSLWYLSTGAGVEIARCSKGSSCTAADFAAVIGPVQVLGDDSATHAPWLLDPGLDSNVIVGTCRGWRGPVVGGALWSTANDISGPFGAPLAGSCGGLPVVRSLAAGGTVIAANNAQNAGSQVIYAGLAGTQDGGQGFGGHLFVTTAAGIATSTTAWTDAALAQVTNDVANAGKFNPGGFDVSSVTADPHDATGSTVYVTVMGFSGNGVSAPLIYRSTNAGASWTNITSNLPDAPANSVAVDPNDANTLYVALDTGVYVTTSVTSCASSNCWSVYGVSLPNAPVVQLVAAAGVATGDGRLGELRAATYGRGIWQIPLLTATSSAAPAIALSPTSVTYSSQAVGTASLSVTITVTNSGNATLTISSVVTTGDFVETDNCAGTAVVQNGTCTVQVRFAPTATGARTGLLTVYGNVAGGQATAALSGTGLPGAAVVLTPLTLAFPSTSVGATSVAQNITISNTGGTKVNLQSIAIAGNFKIAANTCGASLASGTGCTVSIAFIPATAGPLAGTLTVVDDAGTQVASLSGTATNPPTDVLSPLALTFSSQQQGTASAAQQVTLTNSGDVALTLIAAQVMSGDFAVVNGCGNSLNAHSSCSMQVTFAPKSVGTQTGALAIADEFRTQTVALSGIGIAPPGVSLSPTSLSFGTVGVGLSEPAQTVTLTNNGGVALAISGVAVTGDFSLMTGGNTCGSSLAPGGVCTVQVLFTPTVVGVRTGTVTFTDSATSSSQSAQLSGTGVDFSLAADGPTSATIASGGSATYLLLLSSAAGLNGAVTFTCSGVPAHSICTVNPAAGSLGGTSTVTVTIATGQASASVVAPPLPWDTRILWAAILPVLFLRRRRIWPGLLMLGLLVGCGTGRTVPSTTGTTTPTVVTPDGTSSIVVAASSTGLVRSVGLTLVVQ